MRVHVNFVGRVQGVGFRATARSIAQRYPITGWVRNEPDNSVRLEVQGDAAQIEAFLAELGRVMVRNIQSSTRATVADKGGEVGFVIER
jgi:acylphosphatase